MSRLAMNFNSTPSASSVARITSMHHCARRILKTPWLLNLFQDLGGNLRTSVD